MTHIFNILAEAIDTDCRCRYSPQNGYCHRFAVNKSHEQAIATDASPTSQPHPQRGGPCLYVSLALRKREGSGFETSLYVYMAMLRQINFAVQLACDVNVLNDCWL